MPRAARKPPSCVVLENVTTIAAPPTEPRKCSDQPAAASWPLPNNSLVTAARNVSFAPAAPNAKVPDEAFLPIKRAGTSAPPPDIQFLLPTQNTQDSDSDSSTSDSSSDISNRRSKLAIWKEKQQLKAILDNPRLRTQLLLAINPKPAKVPTKAPPKVAQAVRLKPTTKPPKRKVFREKIRHERHASIDQC